MSLIPSTARFVSSALVIDPAKVSTPRSTSQSGIDVAMTRMSFAPSSISCRTRCEPRNPVPPVISVTARCRFSMAARRLVPGVMGVMRAVRLPGVLGGITFGALYLVRCLFSKSAPTDYSLPSTKYKELRSAKHRNSFFFVEESGFALGSPLLAQCLGVECVSRAIPQVYYLVPYTRGDQPIGFGARQAFRHLFQFFDLEEPADARADIAVLDDRGSFWHRLVRAIEIHRQNANARVQREVTDDGFVVGHDARHRTRAFRENKRVVTLIEERACVPQRLS